MSLRETFQLDHATHVLTISLKILKAFWRMPLSMEFKTCVLQKILSKICLGGFLVSVRVRQELTPETEKN